LSIASTTTADQSLRSDLLNIPKPSTTSPLSVSNTSSNSTVGIDMNSHSSLDYSNESSVVGLAEQMQQVSIVSDSATAMGHASANQHQSHNTTPSVEITKPFPDSHTPDSGSVHSSEAEHMSSYASRAAHNTPPTIEDAQITVRALVSTKEAGVIIGKSGSVIAQLRDSAGVRAGVTHAVSGVTDRVLSVIGHLKNVAAAYELVARTMIDNPVTTVPVPSPSASMSVQESIPQTIIRILIGHNLMGSVIGRQGLKIKSIQDASGARLVATKEMLPQSTERVVEIHGTVD
ncbi:RNA binding protein, heterogenous nuclear RNP-K like protein, partial [Spiromyces aspiralis]